MVNHRSTESHYGYFDLLFWVCNASCLASCLVGFLFGCSSCALSFSVCDMFITSGMPSWRGTSRL